MKIDKFSFDEKAYKVKVDLDKVSQIHIPGKGGVMLDGEMPVGESWNIDYPVLLNAQFILAKVKNDWLRIGTKYPPLHFSRIRVLRKEKGFELFWELKPWSGYTEVKGPELLAEEFPSYEEAIGEYKGWMERTFKLKVKEENPDIPQWIYNTRLILILDMWAATGRICHDYQDVINLVKDLKELNTPADTLIYLAGWHWKFDAHFPNFQPAKELGGEKKFEELVEGIHRAGFRIMAHMHIMSLDYSLPEYLRFWKYQIIDSEGNKCGWPGVDLIGATYQFPYMRPCARPWQEHLCAKIISPTLKYELDAIYLDQTLVTIDDPKCNMEEGFNQLLRRIREGIPGALIGGEGIHERIVKSVPFCQIHGAAWAGSWGEISYEKDSTILVDLFEDYAILFAHLSIPPAIPAPGLALYGKDYFWYTKKNAYKVAQRYYDFREAIKTLRLNYRDYGIDEETRRVIKKLRHK